jgi:hypothetical protein
VWTLLTFRSNFRLFPSHICSIWFCEVPLLEAILVISLSVEKLGTVESSMTCRVGNMDMQDNCSRGELRWEHCRPCDKDGYPCRELVGTG